MAWCQRYKRNWKCGPSRFWALKNWLCIVQATPLYRKVGGRREHIPCSAVRDPEKNVARAQRSGSR